MASTLRTGCQIAAAALVLGALAGCSSSGAAPSAAGSAAPPAQAQASASAAGNGPGGDAASAAPTETVAGSPLPVPTATRSVRPPTEPTPTATASGAARQPCRDLPAAYTRYAQLSRAWTAGGRHLLSLTFESCTFVPLNEEAVSYKPLGARHTVTVRPDAVVQVLHGTQLVPVPFAHFSVGSAGQPYYYVRLDSSGAVAGVQQIYHP